MKMILALAATTAVIATTAPAEAAISVSFPATANNGGRNFYNFEGYSSSTPASMAQTSVQGGEGYSGSIPDIAARPLGGTGSFLAIGPGTESALLKIAKGAYAVSFIWGSIDDYNSVVFNYANGSSQTFTGSDIAALNGTVADGNQSAPSRNPVVQFNLGGSNVDGQAGMNLRSVSFNSDRAAFEIDNLYVNAVPEPATWGMMILGFGMIGGTLRARARRRPMSAIA